MKGDRDRRLGCEPVSIDAMGTGPRHVAERSGDIVHDVGYSPRRRQKVATAVSHAA